MKLSTWRTQIVDWFNSSVHIDSMELKTPVAPGLTTGFVEPLRDVEYSVAPEGIIGQASQHLYLLARYPASLKFYQLPLGGLEGTHSTLAQRILLNWGTWGISELTYQTLDQPVRVMETGDGLGEWLVELHWLFRFTWLAEPEEPLVTDRVVSKVKFGLYRENLQGTESVLDTELTNNPLTLNSGDQYLTNEDSYLVSEVLE